MTPVACWCIAWLLMMTAISRKQLQTRLLQMGPRIRVSESDFLKIAETERGLVIRAPGFWGMSTYLLRSGDYYYFTMTKNRLEFPSECRILESTEIRL